MNGQNEYTRTILHDNKEENKSEKNDQSSLKFWFLIFNSSVIANQFDIQSKFGIHSFSSLK